MQCYIITVGQKITIMYKIYAVSTIFRHVPLIQTQRRFLSYRHDHIQRTFLGNAETTWDINRRRSLAGQKEVDSPTGSHAFPYLLFQVRPNYLL